MVDYHRGSMIEKQVATRAFSPYYPWILGGLWLLFLLTFPILKSPILIVIPVIITGWFYYALAGLIAALLAFFVNLFLIQIFINGPAGSGSLTLDPTLLIATILLGIVSVGAGYLRQLFENLYRREELLRAEERFVTLLGIIIKKILEHSDWNALDDQNLNLLFYDIIHHLTNLFVADSGRLLRWEADPGQILLVASTMSEEVPPASDALDSQEIHIAMEALQTGQILAVEDLATSRYGGAGDASTLGRARSALCIPVMARKYTFGVALLTYQKDHQFTAEEITYAERIGHQVGLALWGLRQDQINIQQLNETMTIMKIGQALSETERIGLNTVLQLIVDSARKLIGQAEKAVIHLVEEETLVAQATSGFYRDEKTIPRLKMHIGNGAAGQVLRDGRTINIGDINTDVRFLPSEIKPVYRSLLVSPVQSSGKRLGTISVESQKPQAFSEHDAKLLEALGNQAAIAIDNTRLFEATRRSLDELGALYRINQRLAASLDADVLIREVVDLLQQSFHYYHVQVYLIDSEQRDSVFQHGSGEIGNRLKATNHRLVAGEGIVGHVAYTSKAFITNDVDRVVFFIRNPLLPDTKSELAVPICIGDKVLGVLDIQQCPPGRLSERDLQSASTVAEQLAEALQKATLYADLETSLQHEQTMRSQLLQSERLALMGRLLASVSHELNNPLQTIQNALFLLRDELQPAASIQELDIISTEIDRMVTLLERLRSTYRPLQREEFVPVQINNIIGDVGKLIATHLRHKNISFEFRFDPNLPRVVGLADHLKQVALNLFINAVDAMPQGGNLRVDTYVSPIANEVVISMTDTGMGIEPDLLPRIFEPFVTSKRSGTGLGLTITHEIVEQHGGRILAESLPNSGARFTIWLPTYSEEEIVA